MHQQKGFTLIELMVVIAIIGILATTAIVNFGRNDDRDVRLGKDRLTSFLREVQNKALAGDRSGISTSGKVCGFGFRKTGSNIESFFVATENLDADCGANWESYVKTTLSAFSPPNGTAVEMSGNVFFISPSAMTDCDVCALPTALVISKGSANSSITIDSSGKIY